MSTTEGAMVPVKASAEVEFRGLFKVRLLLGEDDKRRIVVNELASAMGLDPKGLRDRVNRSFAKGRCMTPLPSAGGDQAVLALDIHYLPALLMGIEVERCREAIRPRLTEIQEEFYDVLASYTFEGAAVNPAFTPPLPPASASTLAREELPDMVTKAMKEGDLVYAACLVGVARTLARKGPVRPMKRLPKLPADLAPYRESILSWLRQHPAGLPGGTNALTRAVGGKSEYLRAALRELELPN